MSFLDRIRNSDKQEVELDPDQVDHHATPDRSHDAGGDEVELQEENNERDTGRQESGSFLPGTGAETSSSSDRRTSDGDDRLERIMEQNERIIELLETIADTSNSSDRTSSTSSTSGSTATDSDELW